MKAIMTIMMIAMMPAPTVFVLLRTYTYHAPRSLLGAGCEPNLRYVGCEPGGKNVAGGKPNLR